jgi:hypothetical protein
LQPVVSNNFFSDTRGNKITSWRVPRDWFADALKRDLIMMKKCLLAVTLLSLALAGGCAKGGNGAGNGITVKITDNNVGAAGLNLTIQFAAAVTGTSNPNVAWTLIGPSCNGTPNPCGSFTSTTGTTATYVGPPSVPSDPAIVIKAVSEADSTAFGEFGLNIVPVTTDVTPLSLNVGKNLTQQFTAVAVPDSAPQTFAWTCTANGVPCANFVQDPNVSGLAYYTAQDNCGNNCLQVSAAQVDDPTGCSINPKNCSIAKASVVTSRVNGTYAFRFSGYDSSNHATAAVGTFTSTNGTITSGAEDELTSSGWVQHSISGGSYVPTSSDTNNSNNAGVLLLTTGAFPNKFQAVLDGAGDISMIEADGHGNGSGIAQKSVSSNLFTGDQTYAFGFTGVDASGNRVGYVGVLPMDGTGNIVSGQMDVNDNGNTTNVCGAAPCNVAGTYSADLNIGGLWHMVLTSGTTMHFDFFISGGTATKANPLTFYAISTDPDATHPSVSGTMVLQDSTQTYNIAALNGTSVSALTGANANVSLTMGTTDGKGGFSGQFDQNNAGTILSTAPFPPSGSTSYTYATTATNGRYTINMLGDPTAKTVVPPIPFVLYASGANRGFLLDQSSSAVITGTMNPQGKGGGGLTNSELPGTYAAATTSGGSSAVTPIAANLLLISPGSNAADTVGGTQYPAGQTLTGTATFTTGAAGTGVGTFTLTAPSAQTYVLYAVDTNGCSGSSPVCSIQDFFMIDVTAKTPNPDPSIIFAQQ